MAYQEGDTSPPHTNVHNDVRTQLDQLSTEFEIPVVLPPVVGLGDVGHVDHHNLLTTAIAELSKHECEDGLPGVGGWATITAVSGVYTPHRYNDGPGGVGGTDWVAYQWTDDGTLTTNGGLVDALIVGGGGGAGVNGTSSGGRINFGLLSMTATAHDVKVGAGGIASNYSPGRWSGLGTHIVGDIRGLNGSGSGEVGGGEGTNFGIASSITGAPVNYGVKDAPANLVPNTGSTSTQLNFAGTAGVVIVRVPKAYADGVQETFHGWDSFALVTDGVVTDVTRVPDNEPHTLDAEWLPCPAEVQPGWDHTDGEFTPPPAPTRDDLIAELKERIKELQKDTK